MPKYSPQYPILKHPQPMFLLQCERPSFTPIQNNKQNYGSGWRIFGLLCRSGGKFLPPLPHNLSVPSTKGSRIKRHIFLEPNSPRGQMVAQLFKYIHHRVHNSPTSISMMSQMKQFHALSHYFPAIKFNILLPHTHTHTHPRLSSSLPRIRAIYREGL